MVNLAFAVLLGAPLVGFLVNAVRLNSPNTKLSGWIASGAVGISFLSALWFFGALLLGAEEGFRVLLFDWIPVANLNIPFAFVVDPVSSLMILVITGVGFLIHVFSTGYMSHDETPTKFFVYLNLFVFNMLILVLGDNLPVLFVGWEGVGLCSYLLIGYWFSDVDKANAGMKAFLFNRVGDACFLIGMFILFTHFGTLSFSQLNSLASGDEVSLFSPLGLGCLFLFLGATGKSAQIPLYVWLPDAMAGPTPVSALIHAATMVTAGVYLIVRLSFAFDGVTDLMQIIAWIGVLTAFFAATIAITQNDIKKILAYSTVSQLGFMFLAVGVGAYGAALFHLITHAFFKALMFLGSASVIHAMDEEQDIRKMGGLKKHLPWTHWTFVIGWLAIIGLPPFSGFFSKDEILWFSLVSPKGAGILYALALVTAFLTAFYMTRLMALTFWGEARFGADKHPHESPLSMVGPLVALAVLAAVGGFMGIPHALSEILPGHPPNALEHWLHSSIPHFKVSGYSVAFELALMACSVLLAGCAAYFALQFGRSDNPIPGSVGRLVEKKYLVDEVYAASVIEPAVSVGRSLWLSVDARFFDGFTFFLGDLARGWSRSVKSLQVGNVQQYALLMVIGITLAGIYLMGWW